MIYFIDPAQVTVWLDMESICIPATSSKFHSMIDACHNNDENLARMIANSLKTIFQENAYIDNKDRIMCNGYDATDLLKPKLVEFIKLLKAKGVIKSEIKRILPFLCNMFKNPYIDAVTEIYDFCKAMDFEITDDGCFLAYKNVNKDLGSIYDHGKTKHAINMVTKCDAFDTDRYQTCSKGLHFCSHDYLESYPGDVTIVVKVNPKDVVAIPVDYDNKKGRCRQYKTVGIIGPMKRLSDLQNKDISDGSRIIRSDDELLDAMCDYRKANPEKFEEWLNKTNNKRKRKIA